MPHHDINQLGNFVVPVTIVHTCCAYVKCHIKDLGRLHEHLERYLLRDDASGKDNEARRKHMEPLANALGGTKDICEENYRVARGLDGYEVVSPPRCAAQRGHYEGEEGDATRRQCSHLGCRPAWHQLLMHYDSPICASVELINPTGQETPSCG
ncbi:unnamed protein product, partial [Mesorhabditis spiculigera]